MLRLGLITFIILTGLIPSIFANTDLIERGNQAYRAGDYAAALKFYADALPTATPDEKALIEFNRANTLHQLRRFADANNSYTNAEAAKPDWQAEADYNRANTAWQQAQEIKDTAPQEALKILRTGEELYRRALAAQPTNRNSAYNLELTRREIKRLEAIVPPETPADDREQNNEANAENNKQSQAAQNQSTEPSPNNQPQPAQNQASETPDDQQSPKPESPDDQQSSKPETPDDQQSPPEAPNAPNDQQKTEAQKSSEQENQQPEEAHARENALPEKSAADVAEQLAEEILQREKDEQERRQRARRQQVNVERDW